MFVQDWLEPEGGIHGYLKRFLASGDPTFQHIAIWTLLQLLEADDLRLRNLISQSTEIVTMIKNIGDKDMGSDDEAEDGEGEVVALARKSRDLVNGGNGNFGKVQ
jgi:vacuolar protein 8